MHDAGVLLLHGKGRTSASMAHMARALASAGFRTLNLDYPSRTRDLAALADHLQARAGGWCAAHGARMHVVTHSMGGLVARAWIARHAPAGVARIVMLAPLNQGSEIADLLGRSRAYRANDGKVSVASTRLEGMTDHLVLPVTHTFLMHDPQVVAATIAFLRDGRFPGLRPAAFSRSHARASRA